MPHTLTNPITPPHAHESDGPVPSEAAAIEMIQDKTLSHVAIIMDGNRRWAKLNNQMAPQGHLSGYKALKTLLKYASQTLKLPVLTVYAFSTENWKRSDTEVAFLMQLLHQTLSKELQSLLDLNIQLRFIGNMADLPDPIRQECERSEAKAATNTGMILQVALSYGGRAEIVRACQQLAQDVKDGTREPNSVTEADLSAYMYTQAVPDPDLIIRTGGEYRLSNFLLWQAAFAEIYTTSVLWPDFSPDELLKALADFQHRQRRFGQ